MKEHFKNILKALKLYHPLQSSYRSMLVELKRNFNRIKYRKYIGSGFLCNVCGAQYRQFVPDLPSAENKAAIELNHVIAGYGQNILCPNCMSTARERLVIAMLAKEKLAQKNVLHMSPEKYVYEFLRKNDAIVTSADLSPGFYKRIDKDIRKEDATDFDFDDESFDLVVANHILEHIPDDSKALREMYRILRPGGIAILQVPYSETIGETLEDSTIQDPALRSKLYGQQDHVRIYQLKAYLKKLERTGFCIKVSSYADLNEHYKLAIQKGESFFHIQKPSPLQ